MNTNLLMSPFYHFWSRFQNKPVICSLWIENRDVVRHKTLLGHSPDHFWMQRFSVCICFRGLLAFLFAARFYICSAFLYLVVLCVFAACFYICSLFAECCTCVVQLIKMFLNLLVFCLFACVFLSCRAFAHVGG